MELRRCWSPLLAMVSVILLSVWATDLTPTTADVNCQRDSCQFRLSTRHNLTECVRIQLTASLKVPYACNNFTSTCHATVAMPTKNGINGTSGNGHCGNGTAKLLIVWAAGHFQLQLDFQQQSFYSSQIMTSIEAYTFAGRLSLQVDLRDPIFANASIDQDASQIVTFVSSKKIFLFAAPLGLTFLCHTPESAQLHQQSRREAADPPRAMVTFPSVSLDAFRSSAPTGGLLDGPFLCEADSNRQARDTTILVIAGILGVCMFVIVCGSIVTRLNKNAGYSSME